MNIQIFSYEELVHILKHNKHLDYNLIWNWFGDLEDVDFEYNKTLYFSENAIEVKKGDFFAIDHKKDMGMVLHGLSNLTNDIYKLVTLESSDK